MLNETLLYPARRIEVPYGSGDEVLELEVSSLPEPQEMIAILEDQKCKIIYWLQSALEYYRQGKHDTFEQLLTACLASWNLARVKDVSNSYADAFKHRIIALDLLANYYVRKANSSKKLEVKRDFLTKAAQKFTEVDKSEIVDKQCDEFQYHLVARAYYCLIEGRSDHQADSQFGFVLQQQPENVPSLLGRARIEFNKKEEKKEVSLVRKKTALSLYKKALQVCPACPADVRLGLGICFYTLNMQEKAESAFKRALSLDSKCVGALTGLAIIELDRKTTISIKRGIEYLTRAYKIEPNHSPVLILLADHFFYANELEKAIKLATRALENTELEAMQAQACYQLGRAYHKQKEYDRAFEFYYKACDHFSGPQSYLAYYGLGQLHIHRNEFEQAIQAFETVLKTNPDNYETLKVLASLYIRIQTKKDHKDLAKAYLKKVTESHPDDVEAWVELASLCEQTEPQAALAAYKTSIKLYDAKSQPVPPELYNNLAALLFSTDALDEAEKYYNLAQDRCEEEMQHDELHYDSIKYTIKYNTGRLYEAKHQLIEAEDIYKQIIVAHPLYIDCYLRLGCMERDRGNIFDASDRFKATFRSDPNNWDAWTLIGNLHYSKVELKPAQRKFEYILSKTKHNPDIYSLLTVGNVWLQSQYTLSSIEKELLIEQRARALRFFKTALQYDHKNIYAANGIGCIFAVKRLFNEARDIFSQVREATADFPDVWINIAHIYVEQRQYAAAVQMYENCLKKFYNNNNTDIFLYIARAFFKANKLIECKKILLRARYLNPSDLVIIFNLAKLLKTLARRIFEDRKSTYHSVVTAEFELKLAKSYFRYYIDEKIRGKSEHSRGIIDIAIVQLEERDCADLLLQVEKSIKIDAEQRDREEAKRRLEHEEQLKLELARKAEEEERKAKEEKQRKEDLENKRRELLKRQEEAKQKMAEDAAHGHGDDGSDHEGSRRKRSKTKKKEKGEKPDKERERQERERAADSRRYKSRAILSSDSSSSDDDDDDGPANASPDKNPIETSSDSEDDDEGPAPRSKAPATATGADDDDDDDDEDDSDSDDL